MKWNEMWPFIWASVKGDGALCVGISMWLTCLLILSESGDKDFITYFFTFMRMDWKGHKDLSDAQMTEEIYLILCLYAEGAVGFAHWRSSIDFTWVPYRACTYPLPILEATIGMQIQSCLSVGSMCRLWCLLAFNKLTSADVGNE